MNNKLIKETTKILNNEVFDEEKTILNEISIRTFAIGGLLAKVKQYGDKLDREVNRLRSDANSIKQSKPENLKDKLADAIETIGSLFYLQRRMEMYSALVSSSTGFGVDRTYKLLQKIEKKK